MIKAILYTNISEKKVIESKMFSKLSPPKRRKAIEDWKDLISHFVIQNSSSKAGGPAS